MRAPSRLLEERSPQTGTLSLLQLSTQPLQTQTLTREGPL